MYVISVGPTKSYQKLYLTASPTTPPMAQLSLKPYLFLGLGVADKKRVELDLCIYN